MENVEKRRRVLLKPVPEEVKEEQRLYQELGDVLEELKEATLKTNTSAGFGNSLEEDLNEEERKAIEEAYNTNIERMEEADMERNPANSLHLIHSYSRLLEMMLQDYQQRQNINSKEEEQYIENSEFRRNGDSLDERQNMDYIQMGEYRDSIENMDYVDYSDSNRQYMDSNQMRNKEYS